MDRRQWMVVAALIAVALVFLALLRPQPAPPERVVIADPMEPPRPVTALPEPEPDSGPYDVDCPMVTWGPPSGEHVAVFMFEDEQETHTTWVSGRVDDAWLTFRAPTPQGAGLVTLRGHERSWVAWWTRRDGEIECHFPHMPKRLATTRVVADTPLVEDDDAVTFEICTHYEPTWKECKYHQVYQGESGLEFSQESGTWKTRACRRWGDLQACTAYRDTTFDDEAAQLHVDWPDPPAGTGVAVTMVDERVFVDRVVQGSPADLAGIVAGEEIADIHGDLPGWRPVGFREVAPGRDGEPVTLLVYGEDGEREVELQLARIEDR